MGYFPSDMWQLLNQYKVNSQDSYLSDQYIVMCQAHPMYVFST